MRKIDALAAGPQMVDHMAPIWNALPKKRRGIFYVRPGLLRHAKRAGIKEAHHRVGSKLRMGDPPVLVANPASLREVNHAGRKAILMTHCSGETLGNGKHIEPSYLRAPGSEGAIRGRECENVLLFLAPGRHIANVFTSAWPDIPVVQIGCPKMDPWHRKTPERNDPPTVCISFTWDWMPRKEIRGAWQHFKDVIPALADGPWRLIGNAHPRMKSHLQKPYKEMGVGTQWRFSRILEDADVYVTDRSSTLFEFASTGKPVVLLNAPWYQDVDQNSLRFWKAAHVGLHCNDPADLSEVIAQALKDPPAVREQREDAVAMVYTIHDGTAAETAVNAIIDTLKKLPEKKRDRLTLGGNAEMARAIEMLKRVYWKGKQVSKGEELTIGKDINLSTATRWVMRRNPLARWVIDKGILTGTQGADQNPQPQNPTGIPVNAMIEYSDEDLREIAEEILTGEEIPESRADLVKALLDNQDAFVAAVNARLKAAGGQGNTPTVPTAEDLDETFTIPQLFEIAGHVGLEIPTKTQKPDIITALLTKPEELLEVLGTPAKGE